VVKS
jgi:hypothetical protein